MREVLSALAKIGPPVKAVRPENLHVTLQFLGEMEEDLFDLLTDAMAEAVGETPAFEMTLMGLGAFPNVRRPNVVWVGAAGDALLGGIVARLRTALQAVDINVDERDWKTHVTVARVNHRPPAELAQVIERYADVTFGVQRVERLVLMTSDLQPAGPVYEVAREVGLRPR